MKLLKILFLFQATVGNLDFSIGYLKYIDNVWEYLPLRYGTIGGGAGLLLMIVIVIVICSYKMA